MEKSEIFLLIGNLLYLTSYLVSGIFLLRILTIVGGLALMGYYFLVSGGPLWQPVAWGVAFFLINIVQLFVLFRSRKPVRLSEQEYNTLQRIDPNLDHKLFKSWIDVAASNSGKFNLTVDADSVALVLIDEDIQLMNSKGYVNPENGTETSISSDRDNSEALVWKIDDLKTLLKDQPELRTFWQSLISKQLA